MSNVLILSASRLLISAMIMMLACNKGRKAAYTVTTYYTSFDSSSSMSGKKGKPVKYSYEEYDKDSNLILEELYSIDDSNTWGHLQRSAKMYYEDGYKIREESGVGKWKVVNSYEYEGGKLKRRLKNGNLYEEYDYDKEGNLVRIKSKEHNSFCLYNYQRGLKTSSVCFSADTLNSSDTFIYDKNNYLIEEQYFDSKRNMTFRTSYIRDGNGRLMEERSRNPGEWRMRGDGEIVDLEFYKVIKRSYDSKGRQIRVEVYDLGILMDLYEMRYSNQ